MKLFVASDIHGSAYYCRAMLDAFSASGAQRLLLLGDILYHGPRNDLPRDYNPREVIAMLNPLADKIICVRGNCDAEVDQMVLSFPIMSDYTLLELDGVSIFASHGHKFTAEEHPPLAAGTLILSGHTHIPIFSEQGGLYFANPGSASIPKEGSAHSYMTVCGGELAWHDLEGGIYRTEKI